MRQAIGPAGLRRTLIAAALIAAALPAQRAAALDEGPGEAKAIAACDERLCRMLLQRSPTGEDLKCRLSKTWARTTIKEADQQQLSWGFGDARCSVDINIARAAVIAAISSGGKPAKLWVPAHTANCVVEHNGRLEPVTATLAPKIVFKDGKAEKVWVNLVRVDGPESIKATLTAAAQLSDNVGLFHHALVKAINRYIYRHCPKTYPQLQATK